MSTQSYQHNNDNNKKSVKCNISPITRQKLTWSWYQCNLHRIQIFWFMQLYLQYWSHHSSIMTMWFRIPIFIHEEWVPSYFIWLFIYFLADIKGADSLALCATRTSVAMMRIMLNRDFDHDYVHKYEMFAVAILNGTAINSLWSSDAKWPQVSYSKLVQVMAYYLSISAPGQYLNHNDVSTVGCHSNQLGAISQVLLKM